MDVLVIGMGEVGGPLAELLAERYRVDRLDLEPKEVRRRPEIVHICYPYEIDDFVAVTADYLNEFEPRLGIVNSTVGIGTTRAISERTAVPVVHSPVRGKHDRMLEDLRLYTKYVGALQTDHGEQAAQHFHQVGLETRILASPEATELAKLSETTYFGLLIAWAQEVERYCLELGLEYDEVVSFYEEIGFFPPVRYFPGVIGGHCVIPNVEILQETFESRMLDAVVWSNQEKIALESRLDGSSNAAGATGKGAGETVPPSQM